MPFTMTPAGVIDTIYSVNLTMRDWVNERLRKSSRLANAGAAGNMQAAWRAYESCVSPGIIKATMKQEIVVSDFNDVADATLFGKVDDVMLLSFTRVHPDYPGRLLVASFGLPGPINAIVDTSVGNEGKPIMVRGIDFATAAGPTEALGALVDWLENALVYQPTGSNTITVGGFTYSQSRSGLYSRPAIIDGVANS